jgi:hypothetical protein
MEMLSAGSASTINRLEIGKDTITHCHKVNANQEAIEDALLQNGKIILELSWALFTVRAPESFRWTSENYPGPNDRQKM